MGWDPEGLEALRSRVCHSGAGSAWISGTAQLTGGEEGFSTVPMEPTIAPPCLLSRHWGPPHPHPRASGQDGDQIPADDRSYQ